MNIEAQNKADRACALALIRRFFRLHYDELNLRADGSFRTLRELGIPETETPPRVLQRYLGGAASHWGSIIHNGEPPTRLDMQCLRASIELKTAEDIREKTKLIRAMQRAADSGGITGIEGEKQPIRRRDSGAYFMYALTHHSGLPRKGFPRRYG